MYLPYNIHRYAILQSKMAHSIVDPTELSIFHFDENHMIEESDSLTDGLCDSNVVVDKALIIRDI